MKTLFKWLSKMIMIAFLSAILLLILAVLMPENTMQVIEMIKSLTG